MNMVQLTLGDASAVHVNPTQVSHITALPSDAGSEITMATGSSFQVTETPAAIKAAFEAGPALSIDLG